VALDSVNSKVRESRRHLICSFVYYTILSLFFSFPLPFLTPILLTFSSEVGNTDSIQFCAMKPRPSIISSFAVPPRSRGAFGGAFAQPQLQCRYSAYVQLNNNVTRGTGVNAGIKRWEARGQAVRYASTAAATKPRVTGVLQQQQQQQHAKKQHPAGTKNRTAASSAAVSSSGTPPPATRAASPPPPRAPSERLNPPSFTYAPELSVPERKEGQNYASYLFSCGKAYIAFYKSGISNTRQTIKHAKELRKKVAALGHGVSKDVPGAGVLTRAEWQVLRRSKRDLIRLPIMGFLILALGEWLPVVVVYLTPVIPEACRIPKQVARVLKKKETARKERLQTIGTHALRLQSLDRKPQTDGDAIRLAAAAEGLLRPETKVGKQGGIPMADAIVPPDAAVDLGLFHLLLLSARLDCHPRVLDKLSLTPPKQWLQRSVGKKLAYLAQDDELIRRDGGVPALNQQELLRACVDRGIDVLGKSEAEQRKLLGLWYKM
jgi:hypothetical protein